MSKFLIEKQKELMAKVPHTVRPDVYPKMLIGKEIIERVLLYLNSCGHKPWRSKPLDQGVQISSLLNLRARVNDLVRVHDRPSELPEEVPDLESRRLISALGVIEEVIEYLNAVDRGTKAEQLEEITDPLFFYLELAVLGGFTWAEIEEEYARKHTINLKRYEDAEKGDYSWDKRGESKL